MERRKFPLTGFTCMLCLITLIFVIHNYLYPNIQMVLIPPREIISASITQKIGIFFSGNVDRNDIDIRKIYHSRQSLLKSNNQCEIVKNEFKFDCYPESSANQKSCEARGCCWQIPKDRYLKTQNSNKISNPNPMGVPYCYYPKEYPGYGTKSRKDTPTGFMVGLSRTTKAYYPGDIMTLEMDVRYETQNRLRIRIYDPTKARFEVPMETPQVTKAATSLWYSVSVSNIGEPFNFAVQRVSPAGDRPTTVLNTSGAASMIFADQFIQLSTFLPSKYIYGLGEHRGHLLHSMNWTRLTMWNRDQPPQDPDTGTNLYGHHPFYLMMEEGGLSHGVFLLNSNAKDVVLQPAPALTWRTIGGIIDLYVFMGPSPAEVIQQYTEVIGRSFMPPYWSLGFHLCRWGYGTANGTMAVVNRMRAAGIPQDVQWNDIDYMYKHLDFTTSAKFGDQRHLVEELHNKSMKYMMIVDPGISNEQKSGSYPPYDIGTEMDVWIKDYQGQTLVGVVWPGKVVFPDFTNSKTFDYWTKMTKTFHDKVPFDGMWIDMNELSNFVEGSTSKCPGNHYDNPPYVPAVLGNNLNEKTVCVSAQQNLSSTYNVHDLYGLMETVATYEALKTVRGTRPFLISRSTFAGQGKYGGHWSGDNSATYEDMYFSVSEMINMNLFGIPMIGADICGFNGDTTEQLCQRWQQLGAFYPFSRNHNSLGRKDQDPASFSPSMVASTITALRTRYALLPYLYTLFHKSHMMGETVVRPLFFEFPNDEKSYSCDTQFLWGDALMITPVLTKDTTQIQTYFPKERWYEIYSGKKIDGQGTTVEVDAPMDKINLYARGGSIIPLMAGDSLTVTEGRKNGFLLYVALNETGQANGGLFWDDGETVGTHESGTFNMIFFNADKNTVNSLVMKDGYKAEKMTLVGMTIFGVNSAPHSVFINNVTTVFTYLPEFQKILVSEISVNLLDPFNVRWI